MVHKTRNSAKAIIVEDGRLLVTRMRDEDGDFFVLPGGGQEPGETLEEALLRECREEINIEPEIGALRFVRDYIGANHEFAATQSHFHQIEFMFLCRLPDGATPRNGSNPDGKQIDVTWIALRELTEFRVFPRSLAAVLATTTTIEEVGVHAHPVYLGDCN